MGASSPFSVSGSGVAMRVVASVVAVAVVAALSVAQAVTDAFKMEGPSCEPSILNGERLLTLALPFPGVEIAPGDVIVFTSPTDGLPTLKRVIGMPGDLVEQRGDNILVNENPLPSHDAGPCKVGTGAMSSDCRLTQRRLGTHRFTTSAAHATEDGRPTRVPAHSVYVLGDHLDHSNDSRNPALGPISMDAIQALAVSIYWSADAEGMRWERMPSRVP